MRVARLASGTLYPILLRFERAGLLDRRIARSARTVMEPGSRQGLPHSVALQAVG
jgi:hypothetical protein